MLSLTYANNGKFRYWTGWFTHWLEDAHADIPNERNVYYNT